LSEREARKLERRLDRIAHRLPGPIRNMLHWQRRRSPLLRLFLGLLLIFAGLFSFLPVLGIWMLPLGVVLIARDVPFLRRPVRRTLLWGERKWMLWKARRRRR
jgi:hypothetical protein